MIEEYLAEHPEIHALMCMFIGFGDAEFYDLDEDRVFDAWQDVNAALSDGWENGKHQGDCTLQAFTCLRCFLEGEAKTAYDFLSRFKALDYPAPPSTDPRHQKAPVL